MKNLLKTDSTSELEGKTAVAPKISQPPDTKTDGTSGFAKIDPLPSIPKKTKPRSLKWLWVSLGVILVLGLVVTFTAILPAKATYARATELLTAGKDLAQSAKNQNLEEMKTKLPEVRAKLTATQKTLDQIYLLRYLPWVNRYHQDAKHALNAAGYGLDAFEISITTLEPYADLLGLKGKGTFTGGSADERIQLAVKTMDKMTPKIAEIGDKIEKLNTEVAAIDPNRYPEYVGKKQVRAKLISGKNLLSETTTLFLNARPLLEVLPSLLGEPTAKKYLFIFQNDKELRPTGGFITAYAIFRVEHGKFLVESSNDIYELDDQIKVKKEAPEDILTYHKGVFYFNIRDSNLSPDFAVSMKQFIDLYPGKFDFDGIFSLDTHVLVESMKILGSFNIAGREFSAETDKRCDCPKVIYELEDYSTRPVAYVRETRKDIIGSLMYEVMKKALGVSPSQYWGRLFQMSLNEISEKHILAYMLDEKTQKGVESLNMGGRIADGVSILGYKDGQDWDYLHINDTNFAGAKSNLFVQQEVKIDYTVESDETITKTLTLSYKNPAPPSDCNLESGGLCLNGILRNWVRIYVPKSATLVEDKGSQSPKTGEAEALRVVEDLGKTVFNGFLTVRPLGSAELSLKYKLPFKKGKDKLHVLLQKQPGTEGHSYTISVNGKTKEQFNLSADKVVLLSL